MKSSSFYKKGIVIPSREDYDYIIVKEKGIKKVVFGVSDFVQTKDGKKYHHMMSEEEQSNWLQDQNIEIDYDILINNLKD